VTREEAIQVVSNLDESDIILTAFAALLDDVIGDEFTGVMQPVMDPHERSYAAGRAAGLTDFAGLIVGIREQAGAIAGN